MAEIRVVPLGGDEYRVEVADDRSVSTHVVTASAADVARLGGGADAAGLLRASFEFLLEREPKESILARFDLPVIGRYFPAYPDEIKRRLT